MQGVEFAEARDAISRAFSSEEFDMFLFDRLDFDRELNVPDGPFRVVISNVLKQAMREGWDVTLIAEIAAYRPLKPDIQEVYKKYALGLVDESRRRAVDENLVEALRRYGLDPNVVMQRRGATEAVGTSTEEGFQKAIRTLNPELDAGLWGEQLFRLQGRVCRAEVATAAGKYEFGSGFLVGPDLLLTNFHVLQTQIEPMASAPPVKFRFDYRVLANGAEAEGVLVSPRAGDWLIDSARFSPGEAMGKPDDPPPTVDELDFALVRLERPIGEEPAISGGPARGWIAIPGSPQPISLRMPLMILHHPLKRPVKLSLDTESVTSVNGNGTRVRYSNNTEPGSSGSPVFDINWNLVALHHYGDPAFNHPPRYNQGIPIGMIRDRLIRVGKDGVLPAPPPA